MADDEFDIDIYGDTNTEQEPESEFKKEDEGEMKIDSHEPVNGQAAESNGVKHDDESDDDVDIKLGNIHRQSLDFIFNSEQSVKTQQYHHENCNQCWISYHRKYDIALYRNFEKFFGKHATSKLLGYYKWDADEKSSYKEAVG